MGRRATWGSWGLAAAMLSSFILFSQGQIILVTVKPSKPFVGGNVVLSPNRNPYFVQCRWFRESRVEMNLIVIYVPVFNPPQQLNGSRFTGRETIGQNCSLTIRNLNLKDTGTYVVKWTATTGAPVGKGVLNPGVRVVVLAGAVLIRILF